MLAEMADPKKLIAFDRNRDIMVTMAENTEKATRPQLAELVRLLVQRVQAKEQTIDPASIEWTPPARPFYAGLVVAPPDGLRAPVAIQLAREALGVHLTQPARSTTTAVTQRHLHAGHLLPTCR